MRAATLNNATEYQNLFKHKCPTFIQRTPKLAPSREASGTAEPCHAARLHIEADARKLARYEAHHISFTSANVFETAYRRSYGSSPTEGPQKPFRREPNWGQNHPLGGTHVGPHDEIAPLEPEGNEKTKSHDAFQDGQERSRVLFLALEKLAEPSWSRCPWVAKLTQGFDPARGASQPHSGAKNVAPV